MTIIDDLRAHRELHREREAGFTLIELLVVVIIIGILAAIAIPIYLGVQNNAKDAAVKSDLTNAKTAIVTVGTNQNGALPTAITALGSATVAGATVDLKPNGWSLSAPNTTDLKYVFGSATLNTWCVLGTGSTGNKFVVTAGASGVASVPTTATTCTPA